MKYPHLAARLFNTPLFVHPQKLDAIIAGLGARLLGGEISSHPVSGDSTARRTGSATPEPDNSSK